MKTNLIISLLAIITLVASSCQKDDAPPAPTYPVEGLWVGKYGSGINEPNNGFSMVVESGGKITVADGSNITSSTKAYGTWTLTGNVFMATYTYSGAGAGTFSVKAEWSNAGKMINGTYGNGSNPSGSGIWYMDRVN